MSTNKRKSKDYSQILNSLPPLMTSQETDKENERLKTLIDTKPAVSFMDELRANREFNNPENLQKVINFYKIDEKDTNFLSDVYNPHSVIMSPDDYYEGIARRQSTSSKILKK